MKPLIALSMIVKDEAATIARTLESVKPYIDRWVIVDTGSTDDTVEVVERTMRGVQGVVMHVPFENFEITRNRALELCGDDSEFILWLDADDVLEEGEILRRFLEAARGADSWSEKQGAHEAYYLRIDYGVRFDSARVFRSSARWRFKGAVHEVLCKEGRPPPTIAIPGVLVRHVTSPEAEARSAKRWERDLALLRAELKKNPTCTRSAFYYACTLAWLSGVATRPGVDKIMRAMTAFERRIALADKGLGWREEVFESKMWLARLAARVDRQRPHAKPLFPWRRILELYLDAYAFSPHRAEPLFDVADHYRATGQYALCYLFAKRGYEMPLPRQDRLFVNEEVYQWRMADLVAVSAYHVGDRALGREAAEKALSYLPNDERLRKNLEFYKKS